MINKTKVSGELNNKTKSCWSLILLMFGLILGGCNSSSQNSNLQIINRQTNNKAQVNVISPSETPPIASADKAKIEDALKKEGFSKITLDTSTTPPTLRGVVPKDKMAIVILIAEKNAGKKLINGLNEK